MAVTKGATQGFSMEKSAETSIQNFYVKRKSEQTQMLNLEGGLEG